MAWTASRRTVALIAAIGVLLPSLAILQYRWLGELSGLEQMRARQNLEAATVRLSTEFDARLAQLYSRLSGIDADHPGGPTVAVRDGLRELSPSGFIKSVIVIRRARGGAFGAREITLDGREIGNRVPEWLNAAALNRTLLDEVPAIVVPAGNDRWIAAMLDMDHIANDLIPVMLAGCFEGGIPSALDVMIIRDDLPDSAVYRSRPDLTRSEFGAAAGIPLYAIHGRDLDAATAKKLMPDAAAHRWRVLLQHQSGSLEATLGAIRFRNLAIGLGVLVLLAISVGLLVASMHSMQRAAREQLELVARMSHELRTPLATITCAGENLADDVVGTPAEARHYGELIKLEGRRLAKTIGDILLCCRLQARPDTVLNRRPTDVADVIASAIEESRAAAPSGQQIDSVIEPGLPIVLADRDALKMAVKNLVLNAVKYGHGGPVRVSASGGSDVAIAVEDDGPGIPEEERRRIFEPFFRGRHAQEHEIEGSGIGLNIVKQVVKSHGGRVRVVSGRGKGARFVLQLPAMKTTQRVAEEPAV
jgi:signal transduction histidine kinase